MTRKYTFILTAFLIVSTIGLLAFVTTRHFHQNLGSVQGRKRAVYLFSNVHNETKSISVCQTHECHAVADYIKSSIDSKVDPCDDFYTFSCGGWIRRNPIPKSYNDYSTFTKLSKVIEGEIRGLLQTSKMLHDSPHNEALMKTRELYHSCMDVNQIEKLGPIPMLDFIREIGSWSICHDGSWKKSSWDIYRVLQYIQSTYYPASAFFSVEVTNDHLNSTKHLIKIDQSGLSLQREIYFKHPEMVDIYVEYMTTVATLLGTKCNTTEKMRQIMDFETKLAKFTTSAEDKAEGIYRRMNLRSLIQIVPQFPWLDHMQAIFKGANVTEADVVLTTSTSYLRKMATLLKNTSKEEFSHFTHCESGFRKRMDSSEGEGLFITQCSAKTDISAEIEGHYANHPLMRSCATRLYDGGVSEQIIQETTGHRSSDGVRAYKCTSAALKREASEILLGYLSKKAVIDVEKKDENGAGENYTAREVKVTHSMVDEIKETFKKRVKQHDWIDDNTTKHVFEKADVLGSKIGFAKYVVNPKELVSRFSSLSINSNAFFKNNIEVDKWVRNRLFAKLRKAVDKEKWPMFPQTINAMYQFYENEIVIPAGILQSPFFYSSKIPRSLSYGALGSIIGHELTHGFDNTGPKPKSRKTQLVDLLLDDGCSLNVSTQSEKRKGTDLFKEDRGRKFDKNGDIVKEWWSKQSLIEFNKRSQCIEEQYSKFKVQGKYPISGKVTLGENIADNGGTKLSYFAYHNWLIKHRGEEKYALPSLHYTNDQLFFIGYAQEYCSNARPKTEYISTLSEIHAPPKFRHVFIYFHSL
ncbi:Endothelin-converting enzyme 2 [Stylophora pistillata]|uniref:Endothelin-converting enzyme 2 n=1 Tax=Stylophora pistillata TaxID=50429 RepID=A0A2B4SGU7_STYPI|nr:Endothelin-converting enzyme 2 [Stylophora pistillata]